MDKLTDVAIASFDAVVLVLNHLVDTIQRSVYRIDMIPAESGDVGCMYRRTFVFRESDVPLSC